MDRDFDSKLTVWTVSNCEWICVKTKEIRINICCFMIYDFSKQHLSKAKDSSISFRITSTKRTVPHPVYHPPLKHHTIKSGRYTRDLGTQKIKHSTNKRNSQMPYIFRRSSPILNEKKQSASEPGDKNRGVTVTFSTIFDPSTCTQTKNRLMNSHQTANVLLLLFFPF